MGWRLSCLGGFIVLAFLAAFQGPGPMGSFWLLICGAGAVFCLGAALGPRLVSRTDLAALVAVAALCQYPYLSGSFVPYHDTFLDFEFFHYFYSSLLLQNTLPPWTPYNMYGLPTAFFQLTGFTPLGYVAFLAGKIFGATDVMLVFRLSVFMEYAVFAMGLYLLAGKLYSGRTAGLFAGISALACSFWFYQCHWNFGLVYLVPLVLYFLAVFSETRRPAFLWMAGITGLLGLLGNPPYFGSLLLFGLAPVWGFCLLGGQGAWRRLLSLSGANVASFVAFGLLAAVLAVFAFLSIQNAVFTSGRDPATGQSTLWTFLSVDGRLFDLPRTIKIYLLGCPVDRNGTRYVGLFPVLFFAWGLFTVKKRMFWALAGSALLLFVFSFSGTVAALAYWLSPGMNLFRYVPLAQCLASLFVILAAGFGLESFLESFSARRCLVLIGALVFIADGLGDLESRRVLLENGPFFVLRALPGALARELGSLPGSDVISGFETGASYVLYLRVLVLSVALAIPMALAGLSRVLEKLRPGRAPSRRLAASLAAALIVAGALVDLGTFRFVLQAFRPDTGESGRFLEKLSPRLPAFETQRLLAQDKAFQGLPELDLLVARSPGSAGYPQTYTLAGKDVLWPHKGIHFSMMPDGLAFLIQAREGKRPDSKMEPPDASDQAFLAVLGAGAPKVRLVADAYYASSFMEAIQAIRGIRDLDRTVVLPTVRGLRGRVSGGRALADQDARISVVQFTPQSLLLDVDVPPTGGGWLVYADAFAPGWRVSVDKAPALLERAYYAFKAVRVGPGRHEVRFWYRAPLLGPLSWAMAVIGLLAGLAMASGVLLLLFVGRDKLRPKNGAQEK